MNERPNYYSIIPATIRYDKDLTDKAKLIYSEITSLANKTGECWVSNEYLMGLFDTSSRTINRIIKQLKEKKYIDVDYIYNGSSKEIEKRIIRILSTDKNVTTYCQNCPEGTDKNVAENNKYFNNNRKEIHKEKKELFINILNESNLSENMKSTLTTWLEYKEDRNDLYKSEVGFRKLISIVNNQLKEHSEEDLINLIDESMASTYKGITFSKLKYKSKNSFNNSTPTTVNDDGVFRVL